MTKVTLPEERKTRMERILAEAFERFNNELLDDEERQLLLGRIKRLRKKLAA